MWESLISVTLCVFAGHSGDFGEELSVELLLLLLHIERRVEMLQGTSEVGMSYLEEALEQTQDMQERSHALAGLAML